MTAEWPAAENAYDTILRRYPRCIEALVSLASIQAHIGFTTRAINDSVKARKRAKELYDQVLRLFATGKEGQGAGKQVNRFVAKSARVREIAQDPDMYIEIGRLWADESNLERSLRAYLEADRILHEEKESATPNAALLNNIGVLQFQKGRYADAKGCFEDALNDIVGRIPETGIVPWEDDIVFTPTLFNQAVTLEALGDSEMADGVYHKLLESHPEYVDGENTNIANSTIHS